MKVTLESLRVLVCLNKGIIRMLLLKKWGGVMGFHAFIGWMENNKV